MTLGTAINVHLKADSAVAAIAGTRIYPVRQPSSDSESKSPFILHFFSGRSDESDIGGNAFSRRTLVCLCMSEVYDSTQSLTDAVIASLNNFRGLMGGVSGVRINHCVCSDARDEELPELAEAGVFLAVAEFEIAIST